MNGHDLLDAAGGIRPEFVNIMEGRHRGFRLVYKLAAIAACVCLAALAVIFIPRITNSRNDTDDASGSTRYASGEEAAVSSGDYPAMLMVSGIVYQDTYISYEGEITESQIQKVNGYTESGVPEQDGEQNFDRISAATYIIIDDERIAVNMGPEEGWVIFKAEPEIKEVPEEYLDPAFGANMQDGTADYQDAPADGYSEARIYAPELQDLQRRISAAMGPDNELAFVTASMILDAPDRLHVIVNTEDEESIRLLESYNTGDVLLEIEYSEQSGMEE